MVTRLREICFRVHHAPPPASRRVGHKHWLTSVANSLWADTVKDPRQAEKAVENSGDLPTEIVSIFEYKMCTLSHVSLKISTRGVSTDS